MSQSNIVELTRLLRESDVNSHTKIINKLLHSLVKDVILPILPPHRKTLLSIQQVHVLDLVSQTVIIHKISLDIDIISSTVAAFAVFCHSKPANSSQLIQSVKISNWADELISTLPTNIIIQSLSLLNIEAHSRKLDYRHWLSKRLYECIYSNPTGLENFIGIFRKEKDDIVPKELAFQVYSIIMQGSKYIDPKSYFQSLFSQATYLLKFQDIPDESKFPMALLHRLLSIIAEKHPVMFTKVFLLPIMNHFCLQNGPICEEKLDSSLCCLNAILKNETLRDLILSNAENSECIFATFPARILQLLVFAEKRKLYQRKQIRSLLKCLLLNSPSTETLIKICFFKEDSRGFTWAIGDHGNVQVIEGNSEDEQNAIVEAEIVCSLILDCCGGVKLLEFVLSLQENIALLNNLDLLSAILVESEAKILDSSFDTTHVEFLKAICGYLESTSNEEGMLLCCGMIATLLSRGKLDENAVHYFQENMFDIFSVKLTSNSNRELSNASKAILSSIGLANPSMDHTMSSDKLTDIFRSLDLHQEYERAYAMRQLLDMIQLNQDRDILLKHKVELFHSLEQQIHDPDPYVSGLAIKSLSLLVELDPYYSLPLIVQKYHSLALPESTRVKIAETIVQIIQNMGLLLYNHKEHLIRALFDGICDENPVIRKSAFSAISDLVESQRYGLFQFIPEIVDMILCALSPLEADLGVKNSAVYLTARMLKCIGERLLIDHKEDIQRILEALGALQMQDDVMESNIGVALHEVEQSIISIVGKAFPFFP